ncbi:sigma-70 family RNA polymerase sigma factor [Streptomyces sp. AJS327]|uniref:RNA polymerase sigma factor n=1 Tax=Streptomyces sp. AJS327 TaxID=2545265 RepID=UPI0015DF6076|nr:sigma-70 family RNA polymerase sigma factor [Streptomyces sp. AJS327]MBA0051224.1 sigma-70 family RNA polymerase sigma factor [Streptomyces sp. AJS327]
MRGHQKPWHLAPGTVAGGGTGASGAPGPYETPVAPPAPEDPAAKVSGPPEAEAGAELRDVERETAMISLFDGYHAQLVRLAVLLGAEQDAEDVVAEAFCVLHHRWYRLRSPEAAPAYLRSVVCNLVRMRIRSIQVSRRHASVEVDDIDSAESTALLHEDQRQVVDALKNLPDRQREALVLRYWMDLKEREIAEAMGISTGTVKSHIFRGMDALSRALETHR